MLIVRGIETTTRGDWSVCRQRIFICIAFVIILIFPLFITLVPPLGTASLQLILSRCSLHLLVDHVFDLFGDLGLLAKDPVVANDAAVPSVVAHRRSRPDYVVQMLSLIHLRHEFVELVVAVRLDLLQEIIHLEGLAVARNLPSRQDILCMLREAHVVLVDHLLMLEGVLLT